MHTYAHWLVKAPGKRPAQSTAAQCHSHDVILSCLFLHRNSHLRQKPTMLNTTAVDICHIGATS